MDFGSLAVGVSSGDALSDGFKAAHLCFDPTSGVIARPALVEGHPDIPGSGWGEIEDLTVDFLHSGMAMQVSKADLDDAGDEDGNGGGHDYPSP